MASFWKPIIDALANPQQSIYLQRVYTIKSTSSHTYSDGKYIIDNANIVLVSNTKICI
jgi:hypothetical protein